MELLIGLVIWTGLGCIVGRGLSSGFLSMRLGGWLAIGLLGCIIGGLVSYVLDYTKGVCIASLTAGIFLPACITFLRLKRLMPAHLGQRIVRRLVLENGSSSNIGESEPEVFGNLVHGWLLVYPQPNPGNVRYTMKGETLFDDHALMSESGELVS